MTAENQDEHRKYAEPAGGTAESEEEPRVVVRDRRKVDPETGEARSGEEAADTAASSPEPAPDEEPQIIEQPDEQAVVEEAHAEPEGSDLAVQLSERTADLQRLQAEFANYRRRMDRDRELSANNAKAGLVGDLLTVVDDIERAQQHGDLTGAFKAVADKFNQILAQAGLESFGQENDPFDPNVHEAVQHDTSPEVSEPTVTTVLRRGYRFGDKVVRNAMVAVTDYEPPQQAEPGQSDSAESEAFADADGSADPAQQ